jgi:hypothetical protein
MAMDAVSLADFLSRPVLINSIAWQETDVVTHTTSIRPWYNFFNDTRIKYKLNNWAFIKCNLKIKVVFNASPFYYGAAMMVYQPLPAFKPNNIYDDSTLNTMIPYSQMKRAMIYPQHAEGIEMTLPFFLPTNFLHVSTAQEFTDMGLLKFVIMSQLQSANGTTGTGIGVNIYAWAENVVLSGPTVGLSMQDGVMQDGDEYGNGPISRPASAIASVAARLGDVPVIGKFATATSIGASAVSSIAKLFGFTNVPNIANQHGVQQRPLPPIATTEICYPFEKLTVDSKNELTIDHRSVGLPPMDEMCISNLVQRESYLTQFNWTTSNSTNDLLWNTAVTPQLYAATGDSNFYLYMPPMCWLSTMFHQWRGDVIFRFRVVCSQYHKGRLRISFDPDGYAGENIASDAVSATVVMTEILDLSEKLDIEMRIPYQQFLAWCGTKVSTDLTQSATPYGTAATFRHVRGSTNGSLTIRVLNTLSAPVASSTISVLVFVRGAENMEFANPISYGLKNMTSRVMQDGELENKGESDQTSIVAGKLEGPMDHLYLTYMGERISSMRTLLRRQNLITTVYPNPTTTNHELAQLTVTMNRLPCDGGYGAHALDTAYGTLDPIHAYRFDWVHGNFLSYFYPAFIGNRGSVNWTVTPDVGNGSSNLKLLTAARAPTNAGVDVAYTASYKGSRSVNSGWYQNVMYDSGAGAVISSPTTSNGLSLQMPFYAPYKFAPCDPDYVDYQIGKSYAVNDYWATSAIIGEPAPYVLASDLKFHFYAGIGTDFDLLYFLCVPTYGVLAGTPSAI